MKEFIEKTTDMEKFIEKIANISLYPTTNEF
jgi:hypothetical protein